MHEWLAVRQFEVVPAAIATVENKDPGARAVDPSPHPAGGDGVAVKISVVTPSFNQCGFLARTAEGILSQRGDFELEWIVVDGGSTDGSVELLAG